METIIIYPFFRNNERGPGIDIYRKWMQ